MIKKVYEVLTQLDADGDTVYHIVRNYDNGKSFRLKDKFSSLVDVTELVVDRNIWHAESYGSSNVILED